MSCRVLYWVKTAQDRERVDQPAVCWLFEIAAQKISDGPDEGCEVGVGHELRQVGRWAFLEADHGGHLLKLHARNDGNRLSAREEGILLNAKKPPSGELKWAQRLFDSRLLRERVVGYRLSYSFRASSGSRSELFQVRPQKM